MNLRLAEDAIARGRGARCRHERVRRASCTLRLMLCSLSAASSCLILCRLGSVCRSAGSSSAGLARATPGTCAA